MALDTPMVAKWAVRDQVVRAAEVKKVAYSFPTTAFEDKPSFVAHRKFTSDIDSAAKAVEGKADSLTAADLAVAQYQIKFASIRAEAANRNASATGKFSAEDISLLSKAAAPTQDIANRLRSGQSPLPVRRVKVSVLKGDSDEGVKGLQVYVLPAGILDNLNGFTEDEVRSYLTRFSFIDETSPSIGNIAVFDTRVWVGPKLKFAEMAKLVHDGGLKKYRPIDDPSLANPTVELVFRSPSDIVRP